MADRPQFSRYPIIAIGNLWEANSNRDGTGTLTSLYTCRNISGAILEGVKIHATGSTTAGAVRLFITSASLTKLWDEYTIPTMSVSPSSSAYDYEKIFSFPFAIPSGSAIQASTEKGEAFTIFIFGGEF